MTLLTFGCSSGPTAGTDGGAGAGGKPGSGGDVGHGGASGTGGASSGGGTSGANGGSGAGGAAGQAGGGGSGIGGASGGSGHGGSSGTSGSAGSGGTSGSGGASGAGGSQDAGTGTDGSSPTSWVLTWSDEFNGADGSAADPTYWSHDIGGFGWGNDELEYYTDGTENAVVTGGNLMITATTAGASAYQCTYPSAGPCQYTSARIRTQDKFSQQYGRIEARIQIPKGQGLWPLFWMLGADLAAVDWPTCGQISVMENIGSQPSVNRGTLYMPELTGGTVTGTYTLPGNVSLGDDFHVYAIEWSAASIKFFVDDVLYETQTPATAAGGTWEFDKPFFIILDVAVGGSIAGAPDSTTVFPQTMKVDWIRAYQPAP